jgi:hypothetical protein
MNTCIDCGGSMYGSPSRCEYADEELTNRECDSDPVYCGLRDADSVSDTDLAEIAQQNGDAKFIGSPHMPYNGKICGRRTRYVSTETCVYCRAGGQAMRYTRNADLAEKASKQGLTQFEGSIHKACGKRTRYVTGKQECVNCKERK